MDGLQIEGYKKGKEFVINENIVGNSEETVKGMEN